MSTATKVEEVSASNASPVTGSGTYTWNLKLYEYQGLCYIDWTTNSPFRAQQGQVGLYSGAPPSNPQQFVVWSWDDINQPNPFNTGKPWGAGWSAGWIAQASPNGPYVYVLQTPETVDQG